MNGGAGMDLKQLEHFVAVAEERHFTRAAKRLNIVQSGLSTSIRALENELGAELFVRSTRRVDLTVVGRVLYQEAQRALTAVRRARDAVSAVQNLHRGTLTIGTVQSLSPFLDLPALLARFHADHPDVEIHLRIANSTHLLEKVRDGRLDLAFMPFFGSPTQGLTTRIVACEDLVVACSPNHPLAKRDTVSFEDLASETFIEFQEDWGTRPVIDHAFLDARIERRIAFEVNDIRTLLDLVALEMGIALVPEPVVAAAARLGADVTRIACCRLTEPPCWELAMVYVGAEEPIGAAARAFTTLVEPVAD